MNKKIIGLCVLITSFMCSARDVQETFLQANRLYQKGEFLKAFDQYNSIKHKGSATWCNMGNCAFKMNKHVDALVCWHKAIKDATSGSRIILEKNIGVANEMLGKTVSQGRFSIFLERFLNRSSLFGFQFVFLIFWLLFFTVIWLFRKYRRAMLVLLLPINFILGFALVAKYRSHIYPSAIVTQSGASLFSGPDEQYDVVSSLGLADNLRVLDRRGKWCKVKADCLSGWVLADTLEIV